MSNTNTSKQTKTKRNELIKEYEKMKKSGELINFNSIRSYHCQNNSFRDIKNGYGVELETSAYNNETRDYLSRYLNYKFNMNIEQDGSVNGYDMEIISQPYSQAEWTKNFDKVRDFFELLEHCKSKVDDSTGLHIHISKKLFGKNESIRENNINKLILILENYKDTFIKFSRRDKKHLHFCNYYSNYNGVKKYTDLYRIQKEKSYSHSVAINMDTKTYEIRIFKSTLDADTFLATLQLVFNLVEIVNREDLTDLTFNDIINLHEEYKELLNYCKNNDISNGAKIIDKTKVIELLQLRENNKVLRENARYNQYIASVRQLISDNLDLYKKERDEYRENEDLYDNINYIFTQTYRNNNNIYFIVEDINNLLRRYTTKRIVNIKTNQYTEKRVFNKDYRTDYKKLLNKLENTIKEHRAKESEKECA